MAAKTKTVALDRYRSEAKIGDFILEVGGDAEDIVIPPPSGETLLQISETPLSQARRLLVLMCGDQWDRVYEVISAESYELFQQLVHDMVEHFRINQGQATLPGGLGASRTS